MANITKCTPQKKGKFVAEIGRSGNISQAARLIGVNRRTVYVWRKEDGEFAAAWDDAKDEYSDHLEAEADRRAVEGVTKQLYFNDDGKLIGETRNYSDTLLIFRLKGLRPDMYKDRVANEHAFKGPLEVNLVNYADDTDTA